jgi:SAM-dependent methyltransferase
MAVYDDIMVPRMFDPWAEALLDALAVAADERVVDVATGPGTVARLAARRVGPSGSVTGCDISAGMLAVATSKPQEQDAAPIAYVECPADALDVPDAAADVLVCQQGLQFFPDRPRAVAEMRRVLIDGGRLGVAVWCAIDECPPFAAIADGVEQVLGADVAAVYRGGPWGFADRDAIAALFVDSAFVDVDVVRWTMPVTFDGGAEQLVATLPAASIAAQVAELDEPGRAALVVETAAAAAPISDDDGVVRSELSSYVVTARR